MSDKEKEDKAAKADRRKAWGEAKAIIWRYRRRVALGLVVMVIGRFAAMVAPFSSKILIDNVVGQRQEELMIPLALAVGAAALIGGACS
ncbi:MAG: hypothetical protein ACR2QM_05295, partial [Longimicrobiales bacterium]